MSANRLKLNADKTELLFASSGHCCATPKGSYPVLKLGADTAVASSHVRLLGVDISLDLSVDRHVSRVCAGCSYRLRQLRRIRRSLDSDSLATLIYAVVNSRMDYYNNVLAGAPRTVMDKLQPVLNAAARVITGTRKFDRGLARPTALARRSRPGSLQASGDSSLVSERPRTTVSVGALHPGLQC